MKNIIGFAFLGSFLFLACIESHATASSPPAFDMSSHEIMNVAYTAPLSAAHTDKAIWAFISEKHSQIPQGCNEPSVKEVADVTYMLRSRSNC